MVKDSRPAADSETVKATTMSTNAKISDIEDASTSRWLATTLAPAQRRVKEGPSAEAIDRIRARVFGEAPARKATRSIAA
jgi:hypothetical protein